MRSLARFVGLDVHAETIAVAVAEPGGEVRSLGIIPNNPEAVRRLFRKLGEPGKLRVCYEAGPCGYVLYWQLTELGVPCVVVAPTLVPEKAGDRVKTDRRDAEKLARCHRAGDLTAVWVPDAEHEALRDLVRARLAAKQDELRARNRLGKFLLRHGLRRPEGAGRWGRSHMAWLHSLRFEPGALRVTFVDYLGEVEHVRERILRLEQAIDEAVAAAPSRMRAVIQALQSLRGVAKITAATIVTEVGELSRFTRASQLMSYSGAVPSEYSSGSHTSRGGLTKTGNAHLRRVVVEAAWAYRHVPHVGRTLRVRQKEQSPTVVATAWKAQRRLHDRYVRLTARGKHKNQVIAAVARELLGFIWAIGKEVEQGLLPAAAHP
jgi:transposase